MRYHPFVTDPAPIHEHALSNLRYIREAMERATSAFTSIPGWGGVAIGITAVITAVLAHPYAGTRRWLWTWLAEAVVAGVIALTTMFLKAQRAGVSFRDGAPRRFFSSYFAPIIAAAALTYVLASHGAYAALPALWLLSYGASFVSSGAFSIPVVPVMGVCYMIIGLAACFAGPQLGNALVGGGFGGMHLIFGLIIARRYGG